MVGGLNSFDAVLDRVSSERTEAASHGSGPWAAMRGWNSSFVGANLRAEPWPGREQIEKVNTPDRNDVATAAPKPIIPAPRPSMPEPKPVPAMDTSHFKRLSAEDIAKDINLLASDTAAELKSKRRRFARLNHPDRCPIEWREAATTRMKIANQMIDEALRRV